MLAPAHYFQIYASTCPLFPMYMLAPGHSLLRTRQYPATNSVCATIRPQFIQLCIQFNCKCAGHTLLSVCQLPAANPHQTTISVPPNTNNKHHTFKTEISPHMLFCYEPLIHRAAPTLVHTAVTTGFFPIITSQHQLGPRCRHQFLHIITPTLIPSQEAGR